MNCSDVHRRLDALAKDAGDSSSDEVGQMLVARGYVERRRAPHTARISESSRKRCERSAQEGARGRLPCPARGGEPPSETDPRCFRGAGRCAAIGMAAQRAGRELLDELTPRLARWGGATPDEFLAALEQVEHGFALLSASAQVMATQHMKQGVLEPLTQASAAVGLAASPNPAQALERFEQVMGRLGTLAAAHRATSPKHGRTTTRRRRSRRCAALFGFAVTATRKRRPRSRSSPAPAIRATWCNGLDLAHKQKLELSAAVLLARTGRSLSEATAMVPRLQSAGAEPGLARQIAVLLLNAPLPAEAPARFQKLRQWIAAYTPNEASRSAALLALLDADPLELLDDLRIAAEQVERAKLGTGGLQALSLGAKLLLLRAPPVDAPASALVPGAAPAMAPSFAFDPIYRSAIIVGHRNGFHAAALYSPGYSSSTRTTATARRCALDAVSRRRARHRHDRGRLPAPGSAAPAPGIVFAARITRRAVVAPAAGSPSPSLLSSPPQSSSTLLSHRCRSRCHRPRWHPGTRPRSCRRILVVVDTIVVGVFVGTRSALAAHVHECGADIGGPVS